ncbi:MAG: HAD family hydrolase [Acidobacteriia bacterium]|nr:HAD family hydrolase [Terriglobia bacterium]
MTKPRRSSLTARRRKGPGARRLPRISVAVFDLDDTLYDCLTQRVRAAHRYAAEAMARAGIPASSDQIFRLRMKAYARDPQLAHIDGAVCDRYDVKNREELTRISREAFFSLPVGKLTLFRGSRKVLREMRRRGVRVFVVSYGIPETQRAKAAALGLDREPAVERIFFADRARIVTKDSAFQDILRITGADPKNVLVIGDRYSGEIRAGNSLGLHTVHIQGGEFAKLRPSGPEERPDFEIRKIDEVLKLPFKFGTKST